MSKRRWSIRLVGLGLVILLGLAIVHLHEHPPLMYYTHLTMGPRELPARLIRPAFRLITKHDLPTKADDLRAIFIAGMDPRIFVRFKTDSDGIAYILKTFGGPGVKSETLDATTLEFWKASDIDPFIMVRDAQEKLGVCLFDLDSIGCSRLLEGPAWDPWPQLSYKSLIDDQNSTVYIYAVWL